MSEENDKFFLQWEVKPVWKIRFPSSLITGTEEGSFDIFGVDRGSLDISRNWGKIHSVEKFNQGFVAMPSDFTFTIAVKENGGAFEQIRRLGIGAILFDVEVDVLRKTINDVADVAVGDVTVNYNTTIQGYTPWMKGFERYIGCVINREGQTIDVGAVPVREFELIFLQHAIKDSSLFTLNGDQLNTKELVEGDGTFPTLEELSI